MHPWALGPGTSVDTKSILLGPKSASILYIRSVSIRSNFGSSNLGQARRVPRPTPIKHDHRARREMQAVAMSPQSLGNESWSGLRAGEDAPEDASTEFLYPMYVLPMTTALKMSSIEMH